MPYILLLGDIRQGIFYAQLLSFWLVFAGEHMLIQETGGNATLKLYWKHLSAVVIGCLSLFVFDVCERGAQLRNPFGSIWVTRIGANILVSLLWIRNPQTKTYRKQQQKTFISSTVHVHRFGWHFGVRLFRVLVSHGLACILQYQHKTYIVAVNVHCSSFALRRNHLSLQISHAGYTGVCGINDHRFYHGTNGRGAIPLGWLDPFRIHIGFLYWRVWHVEYLHIRVNRFVCTQSQTMVARIDWRRLSKQ